jgi:myosin-5
LHRFGILAQEALEGNCDEKVACKRILEKKGLVGFQIGKTKVFLRAGQMAELDARRTEVLGAAAKTIQGKIRTHIMRKKFVNWRKASISVQAIWRGLFWFCFYCTTVLFYFTKIALYHMLCVSGRLACKLFDQMRRVAAAIKVQKNQRMHQARRSYKHLNASVLVVQTALRAMAARNTFRYKKQSKAAVKIQVVFNF